MTVRVEKQGPVTTVIHSRPEARNALSMEMRSMMRDALHEALVPDLREALPLVPGPEPAPLEGAV